MFTRIALRLPRRQLLPSCRTSPLISRFQFPGPRLFTSGRWTFNDGTPEKSEQMNLNDLPEFIPPPYCPGCGAPSQQVDIQLPGFYSKISSKSQRFGPERKIKTARKKQEDDIYEQALARVRAEVESKTTKNPEIKDTELPTRFLDSLQELAEATPCIEDPKAPPVCVRCHKIIHHNTATPLPSYPTLSTLATLLAGSKHRKNHVYHLLDAADLPMSLLPGLRNHLYTELPKAITSGLTISYIVTRADLLMPVENQIWSLSTWMKKVVKNALPEGEKVEGWGADTKFYAVSAKRGWGIGRIKKETRSREGGVWVVGAVNVGKSRLVREIWPEAGRAKMGTLEEAEEFDILPKSLETEDPTTTTSELEDTEPQKTQPRKKHLSPLIPQVSPTVSHLPGTTAAPIRIIYKTAGKHTLSELIDLPGLERWVGFGEKGLLPFVRANKRKEFGMEKHIRPKQMTIKPGQSLLIAGLIMITPKLMREDNLIILAYPFTSLPVHVTSTSKALSFLSEPDPENRPGVELFQRPSSNGSTLELTPNSSSREDADIDTDINLHPSQSTLPPHFASAGTFSLDDDVTALRNTHLQSKDPKSLASLPYRIVATDILLSGIGWIELVGQVRRRIENQGLKVEVEVFTPEGKGVGQRTTMGAYILRKQEATLAGFGEKRTVRPRRSMKGAKKRMKAAARKG